MSLVDDSKPRASQARPGDADRLRGMGLVKTALGEAGEGYKGLTQRGSARSFAARGDLQGIRKSGSMVGRMNDPQQAQVEEPTSTSTIASGRFLAGNRQKQFKEGMFPSARTQTGSCSPCYTYIRDCLSHTAHRNPHLTFF